MISAKHLIASLTIAAVGAVVVYVWGFPTEIPNKYENSRFAAIDGQGIIPQSASGTNQGISKSSAVRAARQLADDIPDGASVLDVIRILSPAADAGIPSAACRIASDLQECSTRNANLAAVSAISRGIPTRGEDSKAVDLAARLLEQSSRSDEKCAGVTPEMASAAFARQQIAAQAGGKMMRWVALNPALDRSDFLNNLNNWQSYKRLADSYFDSAIKKASPENLFPLLNVYMPSTAGINSSILRRSDQARFMALMEVAESIGAAVPPDLQMAADKIELTPETRIAIASEKAKLDAAGWSSIDKPGLDDRKSFPRPTAADCKDL